MIKEYQIKDDEGNIIGGNIDQTIKFPIELFKYSSEYYGDVAFPYEIAEAGKHTAIKSYEGSAPDFEDYVVTRVAENGFYVYDSYNEEEYFFEKYRYEESF